MLYFADDPDAKPPSILITTLAARAYRGETDLFAATRNVVTSMQDHIEQHNGRYWVPNPAHPGENFADKWNEYPDRRAAFINWHTDQHRAARPRPAARHRSRRRLHHGEGIPRQRGPSISHPLRSIFAASASTGGSTSPPPA